MKFQNALLGLLLSFSSLAFSMQEEIELDEPALLQKFEALVQSVKASTIDGNEWYGAWVRSINPGDMVWASRDNDKYKGKLIVGRKGLESTNSQELFKALKTLFEEQELFKAFKKLFEERETTNQQ